MCDEPSSSGGVVRTASAARVGCPDGLYVRCPVVVRVHLYPAGSMPNETADTRHSGRNVRHRWVPDLGMKPLIAMVGILVALGLMLTIFLLTYRRYRKSHPPKMPGDRGPG